MAEDRIKLVEVGPRDGLQNEKAPVSTYDKVTLINRLNDTGITAIEAGAFVSPKWVPQMADSADVFRLIDQRPGVSYPVLVPNDKGLEQAKAVGANEIAIFGAASEAFSKRNINISIAESLGRFEGLVEAALADGIAVRGYISCVLGCPYEGKIKPEAVSDIAARMVKMGCYEVSLGDTIGTGTPNETHRLLDVVCDRIPVHKLAGHFHDTYGQAIANIWAAYERGVRVFDGSVAGLGGCPYAKGATGNVASEDVIYSFHQSGVPSGVDLHALVSIGQWISTLVGRPNASRAGRALAAKAD